MLAEVVDHKTVFIAVKAVGILNVCPCSFALEHGQGCIVFQVVDTGFQPANIAHGVAFVLNALNLHILVAVGIGRDGYFIQRHDVVG